ncbi:MAG: hypothetical protein WC289_06125 [Patescibacteria group bacterium]
MPVLKDHPRLDLIFVPSQEDEDKKPEDDHRKPHAEQYVQNIHISSMELDKVMIKL